MADTHYVLSLTVERSGVFTRSGQPSRRLQAACKQFVDYPADHSDEPTCRTCSNFVLAEHVADADERPLSSEICQDCRQRFSEPNGWCQSCRHRKSAAGAA